MNSNILISKIAANPGQNSWSQAYSTLNLYVVLSLKAEMDEKTIASYGKEILEKLQREFFAIDEKNLDPIKKGVESVVGYIEKGVDYSIIVSTIINNAMYIVIASEGTVVIKRENKIGIIAKGEKEKILGFSGFLNDKDIIILETFDFSKKIPIEKLSDFLRDIKFEEISEVLAPPILEGAIGTEALISIQYNTQGKEKNEDILEETIQEEEEEEEKNIKKEKEITTSTTFNKIKNIIKVPKISIYSIKAINLKANKKVLIPSIIILLTLILGASIVFEKKKQEEEKQNLMANEIITAAQKKYDESLSLLSLNKPLSLEELLKAKETLTIGREKFPDKSSQREKIDKLLNTINKKISEIDNLSNAKVSLILDAKENKELNTLSLITIKGGLLIGANNDGTIVFLSNDGSVKKTIKTGLKNLTLITANKTDVFMFSQNSIYKLDKSKQKPEKLTDISSNPIGIDTFISNIYLLDSASSQIEKYSGSKYIKSSYFTDKVNFSSPPSSFSINGSVWIIEKEGKLRKFTKGKEDSFSIKGLTKLPGSQSMIYTDETADNVYILDKQNKRIVTIGKNGDYINQYGIQEAKDASSFTVDEAGKKLFILSNNKLYSFGL